MIPTFFQAFDRILIWFYVQPVYWLFSYKRNQICYSRVFKTLRKILTTSSNVYKWMEFIKEIPFNINHKIYHLLTRIGLLWEQTNLLLLYPFSETKDTSYHIWINFILLFCMRIKNLICLLSSIYSIPDYLNLINLNYSSSLKPSNLWSDRILLLL